MGTNRNEPPPGLTAIELIEEAIALLRRTPSTTILCIFVGAVPFWLMVLYFHADMSHDAYAAERLAASALVLAVLFLWMKCWQTVFAAGLRAVLSPDSEEPWTVARAGRLVAAQANVQFWGIFVRPLSYVVTLPAGWVCAFYQNATVLGDGRRRERPLTEEAWAQAKLWPSQNHSIIPILFVFSFFVLVNTGLLLASVPALIKMFFGIETMATRNPDSYFNATFFATVLALSAMLVDPVWRAVFVVRCFHGEALSTGADIRVALKSLRGRGAVIATTVLLGLSAFSGAAVHAKGGAPAPAAMVDAGELDRAIGEVLERREFAWRSPREVETASQEKTFVGRWLHDAGKAMQRGYHSLMRALSRLWHWLKHLLFPVSERSDAGSNFEVPPIDLIIYAAVGLVCAILGVVLYGHLRRPKRTVALAEALPAVPDLESEDVVADQLPEEGWLQMARELVARGELRLGLRAAYLASLAYLGKVEFVSIARHKSNRDYQRELRRRARTRGELLAAFDENLGEFERAWYGQHGVTLESFERFAANLERMRA